MIGTVEDVRQAFRQCGFDYKGSRGVSDRLLINRFDELNLSFQTMIDCLNILKDSNHPLMIQINPTDDKMSDALYYLAGILRARGWGNRQKETVMNAHDQAPLVIQNFLELSNSNHLLR